MRHSEQQPAPLQHLNQREQTDATHRHELEIIRRRLSGHSESNGRCYENALLLMRCARTASCSTCLDEYDGAAIAHVLCLTEDLIQINYLRHLLGEE